MFSLQHQLYPHSFTNITGDLPYRIIKFYFASLCMQEQISQEGYACGPSRFSLTHSLTQYSVCVCVSEEGFLGIKHSISQIGTMFLDFLEHKYKLTIRREVKILQGVTADGIIERLETPDVPLFSLVPMLSRVALEIQGLFVPHFFI